MEDKIINDMTTDIKNININQKYKKEQEKEKLEKARKYINENKEEIINMFKESYINKYIKCFYPDCNNKSLKKDATVPKFCELHWNLKIAGLIENYIIKIRVSNDSSLASIFGNKWK